ncbi:unnamed protein product [Hydatigera taeniaeformis]|uniref:Fibronectin type-III domain-containing protein n=1 Tax=Hydatigena taeniaeformis TaxID=6205 RepID=A0A0R3WSV1_HYDTA|nr:unnamed protein product [Hydatigera taeniaeformis]
MWIRESTAQMVRGGVYQYTDPTVPKNVRLEAINPYTVQLRWNPPLQPYGSVVGYIINWYLDNGEQRELNLLPTATSYVIAGLRPGQTISAHVRVVTQRGLVLKHKYTSDTSKVTEGGGKEEVKYVVTEGSALLLALTERTTSVDNSKIRDENRVALTTATLEINELFSNQGITANLEEEKDAKEEEDQGQGSEGEENIMGGLIKMFEATTGRSSAQILTDDPRSKTTREPTGAKTKTTKFNGVIITEKEKEVSATVEGSSTTPAITTVGMSNHTSAEEEEQRLKRTTTVVHGKASITISLLTTLRGLFVTPISIATATLTSKALPAAIALTLILLLLSSTLL